jgi:undecaprenyl-diphosphatase
VHPYLQSIILGIIEGVTEFLPVSSTAHLRIAEAWMGISEKDPFWKAYSIIIQLGAVLSLLLYFAGRIKRFVATFPSGEKKDRTVLSHPVTLVMIAFVCTAVPALIVKKTGLISKNLESPFVWGWALIIGGVVMWVLEVVIRKPKTHSMEDMSTLQAMWIGFIQTLAAIFPGVSRSMATIAAGQTARLDRPTALEFSFFLSIPIMFAATGLELVDLVRGKGVEGDLVMTGQHWVTLAIGFVVSFFVALLVVHLFMGWVRKHGFVPFAVYRILFGAYVLWSFRPHG